MIFDDSIPTPASYSENIDYLDSVPNQYLADNLNLMSCVRWANKAPANPMDTTTNIRLQNTCWRRVYKNLKSLPETNPFVINWDKNSDMTWLYGPKLERDEVCLTVSEAKGHETSAPIPICIESHYNARLSPSESVESRNSSVGSFYDSASISGASLSSDSLDLNDNDASSISSIDSGYIPDYNDKQSRPPRRLYRDADDNDDTLESSNYHYSLKSALKPVSSPSSASGFLKKTKRDRSRRNYKKSARVSFHYIVSSREFINGISFDYDFLDQACL